MDYNFDKYAKMFIDEIGRLLNQDIGYQCQCDDISDKIKSQINIFNEIKKDLIITINNNDGKINLSVDAINNLIHNDVDRNMLNQIILNILLKNVDLTKLVKKDIIYTIEFDIEYTTFFQTDLGLYVENNESKQSDIKVKFNYDLNKLEIKADRISNEDHVNIRNSIFCTGNLLNIVRLIYKQINQIDLTSIIDLIFIQNTASSWNHIKEKNIIKNTEITNNILNDYIRYLYYLQKR